MRKRDRDRERASERDRDRERIQIGNSNNCKNSSLGKASMQHFAGTGRADNPDRAQDLVYGRNGMSLKKRGASAPLAVDSRHMAWNDAPFRHLAAVLWDR